jgi:ABC-type transporter Mla subunit MlaD
MNIKNVTKKILLVVCSIALVGGMFSSCKDNTEDIMANVNTQTSELNNLLDKQKAALEKLDQALEDSIDAVNSNIDDLHQELHDSIDALKNADAGLLNKINNNNKLIGDLQAELDSLADACPTYLWSDSLKTAYDLAAANAVLAAKNAADILDLQKKDEQIEQALVDSILAVKEYADSLHQAAKDYADEATAIVNAKIDSLDNALDIELAAIEEAYQEADSLLQDQLDSLKQDLEDLEKRVAANEEAIAKLQDKVADLEDALAKMVTGIIVQGVENPIFGSFSLPIGMQSNILFGYYGESARPSVVKFPSNDNSYDATDIVDAFINVNNMNTIAANGVLFNDTIGTVYLTVNPAKTDFTGLTMGIENSVEESNGLSVTPLRESNKKLSFGYSPYTKSVANGLYEADVVLDKGSIDLVKINIESGLKNSLKDVLESFQTKSKQVDFTELAVAIAKQMTNFLDAYAVNAEWTDSLGEHAVYSNYSIAATAFKPLSYNFLKGNSFGKLPVISAFDHINLDDINLDLKLNFTPIEINSNVNIDIKDVDIDETGINVTVDIPEVVAGSFTGNTISKKVEIGNLIAEIENQLNSANTEVETEIKNQLNAQISSIESEINKYLKDMIGDINSQLGDVDDLVNQFNGVEGKVNSAIDKVNSFVSRINNFTNKINTRLDNLNAYLQVTMLYETEDGDLAQLSNSGAGASQITAGKDAVLYPTSYTADIIVPAYKKYVAFTKVNGASDSEQAALLSQLNTGDYLNKVLDGNTKAIKLNVPSSFSGKTLELTYSALDYSGWSSTRKFYIYVK